MGVAVWVISEVDIRGELPSDRADHLVGVDPSSDRIIPDTGPETCRDDIVGFGGRPAALATLNIATFLGYSEGQELPH